MVGTYLWNLDEYDKNEASPSPELADVKITPDIAINSESAKATIKKPKHCIKQAKNTRTLLR